MNSLIESHIFIAGGSRGIGAAAAKLAAQAGAAVSITYHQRSDAADAVVAAITGAGGKAAAFKANVADEKQVFAAMDAAAAKFGPPTGVVASAGIFEHMLIEDMTAEFWQNMLDTNLTGTMWIVKAAAKHMRQAGRGGSIVIYTSTAGQSGGGGGASAYSVTKAAQITFARCMAHELGKDKIRVNTVAPAWTETDMADKHLERLGREKVAQQFPLGRIGQADDVAKATIFLLSKDAEFITGTTVTVDGGMAMRG
jgi:NAD(P)-dependent dehydrogenase (short-subunit alcohol dehydrogenase family)